MIIIGDLNFHLDIPSDADTASFTSQHVHEPTHKKGHTLDIVATHASDTLLSQAPSVFDPGLCNQQGDFSGDHFAVHFGIDLNKPEKSRRQVSFRKLKDICVQDFAKDIMECPSLNDTSVPLEELVEA